MEAIHQWILSVTAVSVLTAICQALMPAGTVKRISGMTCGLLLFVVIVQPAMRVDYQAMFQSLEEYYTSLGAYDTAVVETSAAITEEIIVRDSAAYIEDKAGEAGITCAVTVQCQEKDGLPVPESVCVSGDLNVEQRQQVSDIITAALDVETDSIRFAEKGGGG